jgi:transposase
MKLFLSNSDGWMMPLMTTQPPLALTPAGSRPIGLAAAIDEDDDGGRVFVHGNLAYAWDVDDAAGRRFAAVSLTRIKAATQRQVAEAFAVKPATLRRWDTQHADAGVAGLLSERKGPKRKSKLTDAVVAAIRGLREGGASYRAIAAATGVSEGSVRNALKPTGTDADGDGHRAPNGSDDQLAQEQEQEVESAPEVGAGGQDDCAATACSVAPAQPVDVPVLADPVPRIDERVLARFGLIASAPPVFIGCARAPLAGLLLAVPALAGTGLIETAHAVYGAARAAATA